MRQYDGGVNPKTCKLDEEVVGGAGEDDRDRELIDAHADELNEEALDVLAYQVEDRLDNEAAATAGQGAGTYRLVLPETRPRPLPNKKLTGFIHARVRPCRVENY